MLYVARVSLIVGEVFHPERELHEGAPGAPFRRRAHQQVASASFLAPKSKPRNNKCAHEFIMDFSEIRKKTGIVEEDIAKRLQDMLSPCVAGFRLHLRGFRGLEVGFLGGKWARTMASMPPRCPGQCRTP